MAASVTMAASYTMPRGTTIKWPRRLMVEAVFYRVRSGSAWRMLPSSFPP